MHNNVLVLDAHILQGIIALIKHAINTIQLIAHQLATILECNAFHLLIVHNTLKIIVQTMKHVNGIKLKQLVLKQLVLISL
jgi:hypothetical protein